MNEERPLDEIKAHRHKVLADAESFWVVAIQFEHDLETNRSTLRLRVRNKNSGETCSLHFTDELTVSDQEMEEIMADEALVASLRKGLADAKAGRYRVAD